MLWRRLESVSMKSAQKLAAPSAPCEAVMTPGWCSITCARSSAACLWCLPLSVGKTECSESKSFMVRSLGWLLRNSHRTEVHRAAHTAIEPCVQVGAGEVAAVHRVSKPALSSLGQSPVFALGLRARGFFFSCDRGRVVHALSLLFFALLSLTSSHN